MTPSSAARGRRARRFNRLFDAHHPFNYCWVISGVADYGAARMLWRSGLEAQAEGRFYD